MSWVKVTIEIDKADEFSPYIAKLEVEEFPGRSGEGDVIQQEAFVLQTQHMDTTANRAAVVHHALKSIASRWGFETSIRKLPRTSKDFRQDAIPFDF